MLNLRGDIASSSGWPQNKFFLTVALITVCLYSSCATATANTSGNSKPHKGSTLTVTTSSLPPALLAGSYSAVLSATGGTSPYCWSLKSGSLPAGLTLNSGGQISGVPPQTGTYSFTAQVQDSSSPRQTASQFLIVTVVAVYTASSTPVSVTTTRLTTGSVGITYNTTLAASGGTSPYFWAIGSGALPPGLSLNSSTGQISGTPTLSGTASFIVQVTDSSSTPQTASQALSITVTATVTPLSITTSSIASAQQGTAYSATLAASGGTTPYSWSIKAGTLPAGLILNSSGQISGTPSMSGTFSFTAMVTDSTMPTPLTAAKVFSITVTAAVTPVQITTTSIPAGQVAVVYSRMLGATGGTTPYNWSMSSGALPAGLTLSASTGTISGVPTTAGIASFMVQVKDAANNTGTQALSLAIAGTVGGPLVISPSSPVVNQGATFQFTANAAGTWSCSGTDSSGAATTCKGSINPSTGLYAAPTTVTAQQSVGGYQLLPNNHIFNTRIDSFPLSSNSSVLVSASGTTTLKYYEISKPINYTNSSTPSQGVVFYYTPANNGTFEIPAYPFAKIEGGWISAITNQNSDHHLLTVDTTAGNLQDMYQFYTAGSNSACPACTSQSGVRYTTTSYDLPANGTTDAAGMYLTPLILRLQDVEQAIATGGTINHALRFTLPMGYCASSNVWPATTFATDGGTIPFGTRFRLKSSFDTSKFSPIAQILLTQLKQYGLILADGGTGWAVDVEYTKWPATIANALYEISFAKIAPSNFEVVDESGYMISSTSGETTSNREIVTFTRTSDNATASVDVVLTGVTVNFPHDLLQIQVGAPPLQLTALVNGASNTSVTWSMSPSVGTLSASGLYTPPTNISSPTTITVTATSVANPAVAASMTLNVFPAGPIRLVPGSVPGVYNYTMKPTPYTDSSGNVWSSLGDDGGYANDGGTISGTSDSALYRYEYAGYTEGGNDVRFDFVVPNGSYQITYKGASTFGGLGTQIQDLEVNGTIVYHNLDLYAASGGHNIAWDFVTSANVTNNQLSFVLRIVNNVGTNIGALQIIPLN